MTAVFIVSIRPPGFHVHLMQSSYELVHRNFHYFQFPVCFRSVHFSRTYYYTHSHSDIFWGPTTSWYIVPLWTADGGKVRYDVHATQTSS